MATLHMRIFHQRTDSKQAMLDSQTPREPNRRYTDDELARIRDADACSIRDMRQLAVDTVATAEAMIRRARPIQGTSPAQIVAMLEAQAKVRS
jgi:hypothetical protein